MRCGWTTAASTTAAPIAATKLRAVLYATFSEDREEGEGAETMDAEAGHGDHTSFSMAPREQCHCLSEYLGARL